MDSVHILCNHVGRCQPNN